MAMKYIVFESIGLAELVPIIFPSFVQHIDVANNFGGVDNVSSAGMVSFASDCEGVTVECFGDSKSLRKSIHNEDGKLIKRAMNFQ
jgi:hypothetical protein